jgi:hypothetical protein
MSRDLRGWSIQGIGLAVLLLMAGGGPKSYAQAPLTVYANATNIAPNPPVVNETVTVTLVAGTNAPSDSYTCSVSAPLWK